MIKVIINVILFISLCIGKIEAQHTPEKSYLINGKASWVDSGMITMYSLETEEPIDSTFIKNGGFTMKGRTGLPKRMLFKITPGNWCFRAFVEDTTINLFIDTSNAQKFPHHALIWNIQEEGTQLGATVKKFKEDVQFDHYTSLLLSLTDETHLDKTENGDTRTAHIDSITTQFMWNQFLWIKDYIDENPSSIAGVFLLNEFVENNFSISDKLELLRSLINKIKYPATASHYYTALAETIHLMEESQPNKIAPGVILLQRNKQPFPLSSLKDDYILIDFWASWCVPCLKSIPFWINVYNNYKDKGLTIVGISTDRNWDDWIKALDRENMPWLQLIDSFPDKNTRATAASKFGINGLPYYVLLDKDRRIILTTSEKDMVKSKLSELLDKL